MGIESANFVYWPERTPSVGWGNVLLQQGASPTAGASAFSQYILKGDDYWIDFQIIPSEGNIPESVSVRIALCNPDPAFERLLKFLRFLLNEGGGAVVDTHSGTKVCNLASAAADKLRRSISDQQQRFRTFFGSYRAPVPAEAVFEVMRQVMRQEAP